MIALLEYSGCYLFLLNEYLFFSISNIFILFPGPLLHIVFQKLEDLLNCNFYIILRLTGFISRLAIYPQPLIYSFMLDHSLVFQPCIKSLFQVSNLKTLTFSNRYLFHILFNGIFEANLKLLFMLLGTWIAETKNRISS